MPDISEGGQGIAFNFGNLLSRTRGTVYFQNIFVSELQIFSYNEANFGQGHVNARA